MTVIETSSWRLERRQSQKRGIIKEERLDEKCVGKGGVTAAAHPLQGFEDGAEALPVAE